jgi:hypothetical protein
MILASAAMGAFIIVFIGMNMNLLVLITLAAAVYFGALYVLGGIDKSDMALLKSVVARSPVDDRVADEKSAD